MNRVTNNIVSLFYAIPASAILAVLVILFFVGTTGLNDTLDIASFMFTESKDNLIFILFTCIMFLCYVMAIIIKAGYINSPKRSIFNFITSIAVMLVSFIYIGGFIGLICIPAVIYSYLLVKQMHNKSLNQIGANNAPPG